MERKLVERYIEIRNFGRKLNTELVESMSRRTLLEGGRRLGIARGKHFAFNTEEEISIVMDYCLHDLRIDEENAIARFLVSKQDELSEEKISYLSSLAESYYSFFEMKDSEPGVGIYVEDLIESESHFVFDIGFSETASPGCVFATRIFSHETITMTTGAALIVPEMKIHDLLENAKSGKERFGGKSPPYKVVAEIIREILSTKSGPRVRYHDVATIGT